MPKRIVGETKSSQEPVRQQLKRKKPGGPPKREPTEGKRVALSLRMTPTLKRRLDAAAEAGGRSQSQEAEFRLERSFDRDDLIGEVLTLAFGERLAGLLLITGRAMQDAAMMTMLVQNRRVDEDWTSNPDAYREAVWAADLVWDVARPTAAASGHGRGNGSSVASQLVRALDKGSAKPTRLDVPLPLAESMLRLLGPIAARMVDELPHREERIAERRRELEEANKHALADEKRRELSTPADATAVEITLASFADDIVRIVERTYQPSSSGEHAALLKILIPELFARVGRLADAEASTQRKAS